MIANEMFLDTAQIKDSIISHAKELNYVPKSSSSAKAVINVKVFPNNDPGSVSIPKWHKFQSTINGKVKTFSTQSDLIITKSANTTGGAEWIGNNIEVYEGTIIEETFVVSTANNFIAEISNKDIDTDHLEVNIKLSNTSSTNAVWSKADTLFGLSASSNAYFIEPAKADKFRVSFGDGTFGKKLTPGNLVRVKYRITSEKEGNNGKVFSNLDLVSGQYGNVTVTTVTNSSGGAEAESIESIRKNAPRAFQLQAMIMKY